MYIYANPSCFIIPICCYVFMRSMICIAMLYISLMVFRVRICTSGYAYLSRLIVFKLPLCLHPFYLGFLYVALKLCGSNVKSFTPTTNFLCVFEHMWSKLQALNVWGLRSKYLRFEVWDMSIIIWSLRFERRRSEHLRYEVWLLNV